MDPTVGMFAEFTGVPIGVLTMGDTLLTMGDTLLTMAGTRHTILEEGIIGLTGTALIVGMCVEFTVVPIGGVITDASLDRPPGIGELPGSGLHVQPGAPRASPEIGLALSVSISAALGDRVTAPLPSQTLVTVAAAASHGGSPCGPFGGYDGWWFWPRRHH